MEILLSVYSDKLIKAIKSANSLQIYETLGIDVRAINVSIDNDKEYFFLS